MRFLMCRPDFYGIEYEINPWMNIQRSADRELAIKQWEILYQTLTKCGAQIDLVEPVSGWPDLTFTANAGLYYKNQIILPHFKYKERQGELPYFQRWFTKAGFRILNPNVESDSAFFEGAGDALFAGEKLFVGYGFRSEQKFYQQADYLSQENLIYCELTDPYFYHIDTCFCPLNATLAMWYPPAFSEDSQKRMSAQIDLIPVIKAEAQRFACNAVVIDKHVILPTGCPQISAELEKRGFAVHACDMGEFLKAGGACKCLTLRLD